jgi:Nif-specific regulatory protein
VREEALANELFARYWIGRGQQKVAAVFLAEAHYGWQQWGAASKARDLEERYPKILAPRSGGGPLLLSGTLTTSHTQSGVFDLFTVVKAAQAISGEVAMDRLLQKLMQIVKENAGAQRGVLIWEKEGREFISADQADPAGAPDSGFAAAIVNYVRRSSQSLVISDAAADPRFASDPYVIRQRPRSILCVPILHQRRVTGVLYLENNLAPDAFTADRIQITQILASQAAISAENAALYEEMKEEIQQRKNAESALRAALSEVEQLKNRLQAENLYLQEEIKTQHNFEEIVGSSPAIQKVFQSIERVAGTDATVLITGETGTGKELVARAIHNLSRRKDSPLIKVNCAALPAGLIESELFGHEKGAFTGAFARKKGRFELADRGTMFLDEVGELPLETQVKLLRVLQEQEFERVGGSQTLKVDVRVIAATNRNLQDVVREGAFRSDLFYRLNIFPIHIPPLRERLPDVPVLTNYFVSRCARRAGKKIESVSAEAVETLLRYPWPGNVRELANVLERAVILCDGGSLQQDHLAIQAATAATPSPVVTIQEAEKEHILRALEQTGWVVGGNSGAAKILGLNRTTLLARMKKLGIERMKR